MLIQRPRCDDDYGGCRSRFGSFFVNVDECFVNDIVDGESSIRRNAAEICTSKRIDHAHRFQHAF